MLALRNALFFLLVPGTLGLAVPWSIATRAGAPAPSLPAALAGGLLVGAGLLLLLWCVVQFHRHGGTPAPVDPPRRLVVRGPYRWTRNPMYAALAVMLTGQLVLHPGRALAIYALAALAAVSAFVLLYEEPTLRARFGADYADYAARVPRWIPRRPR